MSDTFAIELQRLDGYRFQVDFQSPGVAPLVVDEAPPIGAGSGPSPSRLLAAAIGNCLSASLLFSLGKARVDVAGIRTKVTGTYVRNERNRLRIGRLDVAIAVELPGADEEKVKKSLGVFEDFCVVTASVRAGIEVGVVVTDGAGRELHRSPAAA